MRIITNVISRVGYECRTEQTSKSSFEIKDVRITSRIIFMRGYNINTRGRRGRYLTWEDWEKVNNAVNDYFDRYRLSATIGSLGGTIKIRKKKERFGEDDWTEVRYRTQYGMFDNWSPEGEPFKDKSKGLRRKYRIDTFRGGYY